jgi:8-oxo-dGTP pyrophosphatase MutT (NUDIX family)
LNSIGDNMKSKIIPTEADRDFTASSYVTKDNKILLMKHQKIGLWLQPGGHIEENEMPHETAKRETKEETGFKVEFENVPESDYQEKAKDLPEPFMVNVHQIEEGHWHCDFAFKARVEQQEEATHSHEHDGLKWFTAEEIRSGEFDMPENVKKAALSALND